MSVTMQTRELGASRLRLFGESNPVSLAGVQDALSALWRRASGDLQQQGHSALARACLWNLVAFHSNPKRARGETGETAHHIEMLLELVTTVVPARVLHLEEWRDEPDPPSGKEVEAWVSTHCLEPASGPQVVCCEQVNLAGYGEQGHSHFPALVRALLVPDIPVGLLWLDEVPRKGRMLGQLLDICDRMIVDSQHAMAPDSLLAVNDLQRATPGKVADLSWLRLGPLRHLVADFFDPPGRAELLGRLDRVLIETSPQGRNTGYLLLGWLLSRCGYEQAKAVDLGRQAQACRWQVRRKDGKSLTLDFTTGRGDGGLDGVLAFQLEAGGHTFRLEDADDDHMSVSGPDRTLPRVALREASEPELVAEALAANLRDPVYFEALGLAARLVETELWNR